MQEWKICCETCCFLWLHWEHESQSFLTRSFQTYMGFHHSGMKWHQAFAQEPLFSSHNFHLIWGDRLVWIFFYPFKICHLVYMFSAQFLSRIPACIQYTWFLKIKWLGSQDFLCQGFEKTFVAQRPNLIWWIALLWWVKQTLLWSKKTKLGGYPTKGNLSYGCAYILLEFMAKLIFL